MIEYNLFRKQENAEKKAKELGCKGSHKMDDGFMPCSSHKEFEKVFKEPKGEIEEFIDFDGNLSNSKIHPQARSLSHDAEPSEHRPECHVP